MRHRNAGAVRPLVAIGKVIAHDLAARVLAGFGKADIAMIPIGRQPLGRPVRGEVNRRLPLPVHALPANLGKLGMADFLVIARNGAPAPIACKLLMVAYKDDLRPARLGLANEAGELAAPDHARLVDHEHVAAAECAAVVLPTAGP
jgi:hypothetical protein